MKDDKITHSFRRNDGVLEYLAKRDHTKHMVPSSFIWIPAMFLSQGPTPAVWPKGGTLSSVGGPCLSPSIRLRISSARWPALLTLASVLSHEARRGVSGFGSFCLHNNGCALRDAPRSNLGCRAEPRQHRTSLGPEGWGNKSDVCTDQRFLTRKSQDRFP